MTLKKAIVIVLVGCGLVAAKTTGEDTASTLLGQAQFEMTVSARADAQLELVKKALLRLPKEQQFDKLFDAYLLRCLAGGKCPQLGDIEDE